MKGEKRDAKLKKMVSSKKWLYLILFHIYVHHNSYPLKLYILFSSIIYFLDYFVLVKKNKGGKNNKLLALRVELRIATLLVWRLTNLAIRAVILKSSLPYTISCSLTLKLRILGTWLVFLIFGVKQQVRILECDRKLDISNAGYC